MADKFQNKYRNGTFRAQWWDYGWNGAYFITICTQNREHYFGEIKNGEMILSHTGLIASILWNEIPKHHNHIELGDFVVMPNHIHGILIINKPVDWNDNGSVDSAGFVGFVGTGHALHLQNQRQNHPQNHPQTPQISQSSTNQSFTNQPPIIKPTERSSTNSVDQPTDQSIQPDQPGKTRFQNIGKNTVSSVIGSYKSAVTKYANRYGYPNGWQRLFHEHIIRNDQEYQRIANYIIANPKNWNEDKFY